MNKVLITGGAGFIGLHLARLLAPLGVDHLDSLILHGPSQRDGLGAPFVKATELIRAARGRVLRVDGRHWTCPGPLAAHDVARLREALLK